MNLLTTSVKFTLNTCFFSFVLSLFEGDLIEDFLQGDCPLGMKEIIETK